ncbi:hypothetical protein WPS_10520 [Vulcanimicrobium alpinum]|uniref:Uncharacterized protein n=1 Tax=Vulcanimicrobium alpinum TaxID=3016050 RepID=A0AAN1XUM2_UNVUL|nr:hypothetical protein [Vulcanimicrobium alpinum]BDE05776.1 hypothetical protein WPS_10520 [Vulcanimicrobium alpinum]
MAPVRWNGTSPQNAGPLTGFEALPGRYIARPHVPPGEQATLAALRDELTADEPRDEDSAAKPDRIRERILGIIGQIEGALRPPFAQPLDAPPRSRP